MDEGKKLFHLNLIDETATSCITYYDRHDLLSYMNILVSNSVIDWSTGNQLHSSLSKLVFLLRKEIKVAVESFPS